mmetsp:Transcript_111160/g.278317  ORF Transcript_111160/g.278317 Transcript_111160/m.278317 type:complete len:556 (+) Transcript_111160:333-2000(+)
MHDGGVDARQAEQHLKEESNIQHRVGEAVGEQALPLRRCGHSRGNLAHYQRPVVDGLALGEDVFVRIGLDRVWVSRLMAPGLHQAWKLEEHDPAEERLPHADPAITVDANTPVGQLHQLRVARRSPHQVGLRRLEGVGDGGPNVGADVDEQHLSDGQCLRHSKDHGERGCKLRNFGTEGVHDGFPEVGAAETALLDAVDDGREVVVLQHDIRSVLGDLGPADAHSDADLCLLQRRRIVDAVTSHRADIADAIVAVLLVGLHDHLLVDRRHAGEDPRVFHGLLPPHDIVMRLIVREVVGLGHASVQVHARDHGKLIPLLGGRIALENVDALCDGTGGIRVVSSDHHHLDTCLGRLGDSGVDTLLGRVLNAVEANELEVPHREVCIRSARTLELRRRRGNIPLGDGQHAARVVHELFHLALDHGHRGGILRDGAKLQHSVWRTLENCKDLRAAVLAVDREHPLVLGVKGDLEELVILGLLLQLLRPIRPTLHFARGPEDGDLRRRTGPHVFTCGCVLFQLRAIVQDAAHGDGVARVCTTPGEQRGTLFTDDDLHAVF